MQNATHTIIQFRRSLETCDPHDLPLGVSGLMGDRFQKEGTNAHAWTDGQDLALQVHRVDKLIRYAIPPTRSTVCNPMQSS